MLNGVREFAGIGMEFVHVHVGITLYTNFEVNLLIANTYKTNAYRNVHQNETPSVIIELSPMYSSSTKCTACRFVTLT